MSHLISDLTDYLANCLINFKASNMYMKWVILFTNLNI